jgi:hypothetical protein
MLFSKTKEIKPDVVITIHLCSIHKDYCEVPVMKKGKPTDKKLIHYPTVVTLLSRIVNCKECGMRFE